MYDYEYYDNTDYLSEDISNDEAFYQRIRELLVGLFKRLYVPEKDIQSMPEFNDIVYSIGDAFDNYWYEQTPEE